MSIPTGLTLHLIALHCFEAAEGILDASRHNVVDTGHTVSRWRTLKEHE